ncbi:hypothetical protein PIB30_017969 [Stylosanthes scabra]|uniref:Uncharacterized protein n=1 Tax=Stylosanthes scabra TaxID=79078 RepID=A0ABU6T845_9FABA|nr:hypothetical protein [Stylosanthes scabra]
MLNSRGKSATLAVLLFFSTILSCLCLILVFHFMKELIQVTTKNKASNNNSINNNQQQEILWAAFSFALVIVFAFTFVVFAIFSGCVMIQEIDTCNNKIAPAPITTDHDHDDHPHHPPSTV